MYSCLLPSSGLAYACFSAHGLWRARSGSPLRSAGPPQTGGGDSRARGAGRFRARAREARAGPEELRRAPRARTAAAPRRRTAACRRCSPNDRCVDVTRHAVVWCRFGLSLSLSSRVVFGGYCIKESNGSRAPTQQLMCPRPAGVQIEQQWISRARAPPGSCDRHILSQHGTSDHLHIVFATTAKYITII